MQLPPPPPSCTQRGPPCAAPSSNQRSHISPFRPIPDIPVQAPAAPIEPDEDVCPMCHRTRGDLTDMNRSIQYLRGRPGVKNLRGCIRFHRSADVPPTAPRGPSEYPQPPPRNPGQPSTAPTTRSQIPASNPDPVTSTSASTRAPDLRISFGNDQVTVRGSVTEIQARVTHSRSPSDDGDELYSPE